MYLILNLFKQNIQLLVGKSIPMILELLGRLSKLEVSQVFAEILKTLLDLVIDKTWILCGGLFKISPRKMNLLMSKLKSCGFTLEDYMNLTHVTDIGDLKLTI